MYRLWASLFPDLRRFVDRSERRGAWRRATNETTRRPSYLLTAVALIALGGTVVFSLPRLGIPMSQRGTIRGLSMIVMMAAMFGLIWLFRRSIQRSLRRQLNEKGMPTCIACGYDLSHPASQTCPECGSPISP